MILGGSSKGQHFRFQEVSKGIRVLLEIGPEAIGNTFW